MRIIGCDLHARQQTVAMLDSDTGELEEKTLEHEGDTVREFYSALRGPILVGIGPFCTSLLRILANRMPHRFTPQKTKKRIPLFTQSPQSLPTSAGVFARNQSHIAGHRFSIHEPLGLTQKGFCRQGRNRPHPG
jgi:hypothetical protein